MHNLWQDDRIRTWEQKLTFGIICLYVGLLLCLENLVFQPLNNLEVNNQHSSKIHTVGAKYRLFKL